MLLQTEDLNVAQLYHAFLTPGGWTYVPATPFRAAAYERPSKAYPELKDYFQLTTINFKETVEDIIDKHKILTMWDATGQWKAILTPDANEPHYFIRQYGADRRLAAMRAYIAFKVGPAIEIPQELLS